jgi:hypothetical protein
VTTLLGSSPAPFFVHDCVTAVSALSQLPGVDRSRIGFTGHSGGGLQTFLAMGADPRIRAAVPIQATSSRRGAFADLVLRDSEQCFFRAWTAGMDLTEMTLLFAPRPVRIIAEYGHPDQADIYHRTAPVYACIGHSERLELCSTGSQHCLSRASRELAVQWFCRFLTPPSPLAVEPDLPGFTELSADLRRIRHADGLTDDGILKRCRDQAAIARGAHRGGASALRPNPFTKLLFSRRRFGLINEQGGAGAWDGLLAPGQYDIEISRDYRVPFTVHAGNSDCRSVSLIVDAEGRASAWTAACLKTAQQCSRAVITTDVFNCGELQSTRPDGPAAVDPKNQAFFSSAMYHAMDTFMAGTCPAALAADELRSVLHGSGADAMPLCIFARGWPTLSALLISVVRRQVEACYLSGMPESYQMLLDAGRFCLDYSYLIPGILNHSDIPLMIQAQRSTHYVLAQVRRFGEPTVDYTDTARFPNVVCSPTEDLAAAAQLFSCPP